MTARRGPSGLVTRYQPTKLGPQTKRLNSREKVLAWLRLNPDTEFSAPEIMRSLGMGEVVYTSLRTLVESGTVEVSVYQRKPLGNSSRGFDSKANQYRKYRVPSAV